MQYSKELLADIHIRLDKEGLDGLTEKEISVLLSEQLDKSTEQICKKIDEAVSPVHQELTRFRDKVDLWAKVIGGGIWAVVASLIASLIFRACGGG